MTTTLMRVAPLPISEGGDDDSTSPHVNTFRELTKSGTPPPPFASPNPSSESNTSGDNDLMAGEDQSGMNQRDGTSQVEAAVHTSNGPGESVLRLDSDRVVENNMSPQHLQGSALHTPIEQQALSPKSPVNDQSEYAAPEFLPPNPSLRHSRRLSSSIPHLLSNSNAAISMGAESSASIANNEANPPLQHHLSFAGLDAVLPSLEAGLTDLPFPLDGNNNCAAGGYVLSHNNLYTTPPVQPMMNPGRVISPLHLSNNQCTTPFSQSSYYSTTPPVGVGMMIPIPPHLTPSSQLQFGVPPTIHLEGGHQPTISPVSKSILSTMQQQQQQVNRNQSTLVQPVLYSAINSLEKYNAGSFDNKMMLARARGKYSNGKAFPGVPMGNTTNQQPQGKDIRGYSIDSGAEESKASSVSSCVATGRTTTAPRTIHEGVTYNNNLNQSKDRDGLPEKAGMGQLSSTQKGSGIIKARSYQNLDGDTTNETSFRRNTKSEKSVTIDQSSKKNKRREKKIGVFRPSCDAYTPRMANRPIKYKPAQERTSVEKMSTTMGTIQRPNFRDALRRVAIILHQHITKIEQRFETGVRGADDTGLFKASMREVFNEDLYATPRYRCCMVRVPMARPGVVYSMRKIRTVYNTPTTDEIYDFAHQLFKKVQLSSECSIVCLIYVEKLMEVAKVPLLSDTWRPIFMCGLLLASKVWQDLSSWNIEFASVYPQFSLEAINRLELQFLKMIKWDLYISSSLYAKYYFALRSLLEKSGFRNRYNQMVGGIGGIAASEAMKVSKRSEAVKEEALLHLSRSM
mmetsp:Transcript_24803/g.49606  ORF Transcript_24803/g.49606 Transcript_24803/m.49606 type:complete len:796 (+) Transcript_24803:74-2461(+)